ncbi:MAG: pilus assembly protein PilM [Candidatus Saelkia tenebricola]|nr:pilus assembly protein PilM [Candidatus Saelkia tenebricola]
MAVKKLVGIELGLENLRIAELDSAGTSDFKINSLREIPIPMLTLPGGERTNERIVDWEILISKLKEEFKGRNYASASISFIIPPKDANTILLTVPLIKGKDMIQFLEREVKKTVTMAEDVETQIAYLKLSEKAVKTDKTQDVLTVLTDRAKLADYFNNFISTGIRPNMFTVKSFSLFSLLIKLYPDLSDAALVDVGQDLTSIVIVKSGQLKFVRNIYVTMESLKNLISQELFISVKETEDFLNKYGFEFESYPDVDQVQKYKNSVFKFLDKFKAELQRSILFYQEKYGDGDKISDVILTGTALNIKGLQQVFKDRIKLNVNILPVSKKITLSSNIKEPENIYHLYTACIGSALSFDLKSKLNLVPKSEKKKISKAIYAEICAVFLIAYGVAYYYYIGYDKKIFAKEEAFNQIQVEMQKHPADLEQKYDNVLKKREEFFDLKESFSDFQKPYINWERLFIEVGNLIDLQMLVESIWISFTEDEEMVFQIDGNYVGTFPDAQLTLRKVRLGLEESKLFKDVKFEIKRSGKVRIGEVKEFPYTIAGYVEENVQEKRKL